MLCNDDNSIPVRAPKMKMWNKQPLGRPKSREEWTYIQQSACGSTQKKLKGSVIRNYGNGNGRWMMMMMMMMMTMTTIRKI